MLRRTGWLLIALALLAPAGCSRADTPVRVSREALGTVVTIEAWGGNSDAVGAAVDNAFDAIAAVEHELDAYSATSTIAGVNADPYRAHTLPDDAITILDAVEDLGVSDAFSPTLLAVVRLYDFTGAQTVPAPVDLARALDAARGFSRVTTDTAVFAQPRPPGSREGPRADVTPGFDFGGAAKG
ncbi:MAG: FAD:protein FMN transferase, partial [Coriobacteriia bacterium]